MCFQGIERSAQEDLAPCGAQFGEEFDEVLFSILAVEEQESSHLVTYFRCLSNFTLSNEITARNASHPADFEFPLIAVNL